MAEQDRLVELVQKLRGDQRQCWLRGEHVLVEAYATQHPELPKNEEIFLDFIYSEYCLREELVDPVQPKEYFKRFPQFAEGLRPLFEVHQAMAAGQLRALEPPDQEAGRRVPVHLNCPHCHSPIEIVTDRPEEEILCPSCGSSFRIDPDHTQTWSKDKLPQLGKFELIEAVGRGAFGTVYRARDTQLQRIVAVKVPRSGRLATDDDEDRFVREARNAAQLQHAGIVPVYEVGRSDTFPYIVSEFVEGVTLTDALTARRFGFRESARLVAQVAAALEHAHGQGVVHRDLKPSNILLTAEGNPRVMDFGLAKREAGEVTMTVDGQVLGTPAYMSPEQASGQAHHVDGRSDVYSLGGILFELLTGELPFRGNQRMILHQVLHDEPRSPRSLNDRIPRDLETICLKAMAKEAGRRYQTAQAMADDLTCYLSGQPITARRVGRAERGWRWCRRNPVVAGLAAAVVLALITGTVVSAYFAADAMDQKRVAVQKADEALASAQIATEARSKATQQAQRAILEAEKAQQVARFLARMFEESAPVELAGLRFGVTEKAAANANLTARQILDRGAERVSDELKNQPLVEAALKETMGNVYVGLGLTDNAEALLQKSLDLRVQHLPREHLDVASSLHSIGLLRLAQGRFWEAAAALEESMETYRKLLGEDHESVDTSRMALAAVLGIMQPRGYARDLPEAVRLWRESLAWRRKHFGPTHRETAYAMLGLAGSLFEINGYSGWRTAENFEGARMILEATPILLKDPISKSFGLIVVLFQHAEVMRKLGQNSAAVVAARKGLLTAREAVGDGHLFMEGAKVAATRYLIDGSQVDEAEKIYGESISSLQNRNILPPYQLLMGMKDIAKSLERRDPARAETLYRQAIGVTREALARQRARHSGGSLEARAFGFAVYAFEPMLTKSGRTDEAEMLYRESLTAAREATDETAMELKTWLGIIRFRQRKFEEAEGLFRESLQATNAISPAMTEFRESVVSQLLVYLADCRLAQGDQEAAEKLYREVIKLGRDEWIFKAEIKLANLLRENDNDVEATRILRHALTLHPKDVDSSIDYLASWATLYELMKKQGADKPALMSLINEALPVLAEARKIPAEENDQLVSILVKMGDFLWDLGEFQRAEPLLLSGYSSLESTKGPEHEETLKAAKQLARLYDSWQKPDKAAKYHKLLAPDEQSHSEATNSDTR